MTALACSGCDGPPVYLAEWPEGCDPLCPDCAGDLVHVLAAFDGALHLSPLNAVPDDLAGLVLDFDSHAESALAVVGRDR